MASEQAVKAKRLLIHTLSKLYNYGQLFNIFDTKDLHVLDAGCGTGNYSKHFLEFGVGHITMLDASSDMLQKAEEKLKNYVANGRIKNIVNAAMPQLPFPDDTFDVVVLCLVLHHLESTTGERDFTNTTEALKESKRVLKRNGLIIVVTFLPSTARHSTWFTQLHPGVTGRLVKLFPTLDVFNGIFESTGLKCFQKMNILGSDIMTDYNNFEGPLDDHWRLSNCYWEMPTEEEMDEIKSFIRDLKEKGELETWAKQHDHVDTVGFITMLLLRIDNN